MLVPSLHEKERQQDTHKTPPEGLEKPRWAGCSYTGAMRPSVSVMPVVGLGDRETFPIAMCHYFGCGPVRYFFIYPPSRKQLSAPNRGRISMVLDWFLISVQSS